MALRPRAGAGPSAGGGTMSGGGSGMTHFADRLADAIRAKGNVVCAGLDPRWELLPAEIRARHGADTLEAAAAAVEEFCGRFLDVVAPLVPVVKPQAAFFEACGPAGMAALQRLLR